MNLAVGIDIGGTKTAVGAVDPSGRVAARLEAPTPAAAGGPAVLAGAIALASRLIAELPHDAVVTAAGVGAAGVIDPVDRVVISATDTLPGWTGMPIGAEIERALGVPVATINDVHAHALGEARFGAGRGRATVLVIAAGTGVGGALILDGEVQLGAASVAGHYGHVPSIEAQGLACTCGRSGHLEMIASGPAVLAAYLRDGGAATPADTREVFALAAAGDAVAARAIATAGTSIGRAIGGLVNALDPDVVVVGGGLAHAGDAWWAALRAGVDRETIPVVSGRPVVIAALGADAAIIGAACTATDRIAPAQIGADA